MIHRPSDVRQQASPLHLLLSRLDYSDRGSCIVELYGASGKIIPAEKTALQLTDFSSFQFLDHTGSATRGGCWQNPESSAQNAGWGQDAA
jgi:hypothetical protein